MEATAFCPAHITGFFKAYLEENNQNPEKLGSMGAGFQLEKELLPISIFYLELIKILTLELLL